MEKTEETVRNTDAASPAGTVPPRPRRRILRRAGCAAAAAAILLLLAVPVLLVWWHWYLPGMLELRLFPALRGRFGLDDATLRIRRIGWNGADIESFRLADGDGGTLEIDSIRADYLPYWRPGEGGRFTVENLTLSGLECSVSVRGGTVGISGFRLDRVLAALERANGGAAGRKAESSASPVVELKRIVLRHLELKLDYEGRRLTLPVNAVFRADDPAWRKMTAEITLAPRGQRLTLNAVVDRAAGAMTLTTGCDRFRLDPLADFIGFRGGAAGGTLRADLNWHDAELAGTLMLDLALTPPDGVYAGAVFSAPIRVRQSVAFRRSAADGGLTVSGSGRATVPECSLLERRIALLAPVSPEWKFRFAVGNGGAELQSFDGSVSGIGVEAYGTRLHFPLCRLEKSGGVFRLTGGGISLEAAKYGVRLGGIRFELPLPLTEHSPARLRVGEIDAGRRQLGSVDCSVSGEWKHLTLKGEAHSPLFEGARLDFRGDFRPGAAGGSPAFLFEADLPTYVPSSPLKPEVFAPALRGAEFTGALTLGAALRLENGKLSSGLQLFLQDGVFRWPESKLEVSGILVDARVEDLFSLVTPPGQRIRAAECRVGAMTFRDLDLRFRLDAGRRLTLEQAGLHWCGGEIGLRPLTFTLHQRSWSPVFQCEAINLAEFLRQTGVAPPTTRGDGALFGKLPVRIGRDGIFFEPAYLYSRPGEVSHLQLDEPEKLAAGMGGAALGQAQLEFASEALRNFNCNWVRVRFNSDGDDLALSLQLDGQPAGPLPFAYDDETGELRRDPAARATFQGIQLNINTRVPLNLLLDFNRKLKQITEKKP